MPKLILIIEDDEGIRTSLQEIYESEGYGLLIVENGKMALDLFKNETPTELGLILLDLMMPVMDGLTFLSKLELEFPEVYLKIPIFIMSARADTGVLDVAVTGIVKKPFDLDQLFSIASKYC